MLNGSSGDGQIIKSNFNNLNIQGTIPEFSTLAFKVEFQGQNGTLTIQLKGDTINNITLDLNGFPKPLGSHNDPTLLELAKQVLSSLK